MEIKIEPIAYMITFQFNKVNFEIECLIGKVRKGPGMRHGEEAEACDKFMYSEDCGRTVKLRQNKNTHKEREREWLVGIYGGLEYCQKPHVRLPVLLLSLTALPSLKVYVKFSPDP